MNRVLTYILTKDKSKKDFRILSELCHNSKNLYNYVNYIVRQAFVGKSENIEEYRDLIQEGRFISEYALSKRLSKRKQSDYISLKAQCSQQIIDQVYQDWNSFFKSIKSYKTDKSKFHGCPQLPKYKNKNGMNVLTFTNQCCSFDKKTKELKIGRNQKIACVVLPNWINNFKQIRVIPKLGYFQIEVVYDKKEGKQNVEQNTKENSVGIDIGVDNLATITSDKPGIKPIIVNGRCVKSINQYYNKKLAKLKSEYSKHGRKSGEKSLKLSRKRKFKIDDYFHKMSRKIVNWCIENNVGKVFVGHNFGWKQDVSIGKVNNQNFVQIPFDRFIQMLKYKMNETGIHLETMNEAYTSKCSALDNETIEKHDEYLGKRVKRGLFKTMTGKLVNADINGSLNILRLGLKRNFNIDFSNLNPTLINEVRDVSIRKPTDRGSVPDPFDEKTSMKKNVKNY